MEAGELPDVEKNVMVAYPSLLERRLNSVVSVLLWMFVMTFMWLISSATHNQLNELEKSDAPKHVKIAAYLTVYILWIIMCSLWLIAMIITCRPFVFYKERVMSE